MTKKPTYGLAWGVAGLILLSGIGCWAWMEMRPSAATPPPRGDADWFLMLRMPEISTQYESGVDTMKIRMDRWLEALARNGFVPIRFSDAVGRLARRRGLPDRAVVIFFSPGYRKTYDIVTPLFLRHRCPAVWLTQKKSLAAADRRYLTYHALRRLRRLQGWDAGFTDADEQGAFRVEGVPAASRARWAAEAGAFALNRWRPARPFQFLTVNADWMPEELIGRLWVETPPTGPVVLTKTVIHAREWGIAKPAETGGEFQEYAFDLQAPVNQRGVKLFWLGTRGQNDFRLGMEAQKLYGELWLQLRFDENAGGSGVQVILAEDGMHVEERSGRSVKRLAARRPSRPFANRPFSVNIVLNGQTLSISADGEEPEIIDLAAGPPADRGLVQLYLTDKLRGTAGVQGLRISYSPLISKVKESAE